MTDEQSSSAQDAMVLNEAQLILAEKRTSLSFMRTDFAVLALPTTILSFLVTTSKLYEPGKVLHLLIPLLAMSALLIVLGFYLVFRAVGKIHHHDRMLMELKHQHSCLAKLLD